MPTRVESPHHAPSEGYAPCHCMNYRAAKDCRDRKDENERPADELDEHVQQLGQRSVGLSWCGIPRERAVAQVRGGIEILLVRDPFIAGLLSQGREAVATMNEIAAIGLADKPYCVETVASRHAADDVEAADQ